MEKKKSPGGRTRIKKGDEVVVIAGADKDLTRPRRVLAVYPQINRILVEEVGVARRSYKKSQSMPQGGIHEKGMPIHISNVMLWDAKEGRGTRVGIREVEGKDGKTSRVRFMKRSGNDIKD